MTKSTNEYVSLYKAQLAKGDIQVAYTRLLKYVMELKTYCANQMQGRFSFSNVSPGSMDYTYFYFFDDFLRSKKLRFGIVLNHQKVCFELWLLGQNAPVQKEYWELLKSTKWNSGRTSMPKYSVLEAMIVASPDFTDLTALSLQIKDTMLSIVEEVMPFLPE